MVFHYTSAEVKRRERLLKQKAKWLADCIKTSNVPCEIPKEISDIFYNEIEASRFERYLIHCGLFKRSDKKWQQKIT